MKTRNKPRTAQAEPNGSFQYDPALTLGILDNLSHRRRGTVRPEGLNSLATRRSRTVRRRYWLPGIVARNPEPTGPRSSWESTQAGGGFRAGDEDLELLRAIATSKVFTEFQRAFTQATGLPVALELVQSFQLSFHDRGKQGPFCGFMAPENRTSEACLQPQSQVAHATMESSHTTVCYGGLRETVVPLRLGNRLIGLLRAGPVFRRKPSKRHFQRTLKLLTSWGTNLDQNVLRGAYFKMRVVSREQHTAAVKLLILFAEHLSILSNQIVIQRDNAEPPRIAKAKDFIREHYAEDLSLSQVAQFANASLFYFCKLFRRATGLTFTNFLARVRIERSRNLLVNPQLSVSEVAYEVGFQSISHFNRTFRRILGQSPTEYRLRCRRR